MKKAYLKAIAISSMLVFVFVQAYPQSWLINGNSNITGSKYLGTKDASDVVFRTNALERGRVFGAGGDWRFGSATHNLKIDSLGRLTFKGKGDYLVGNNRYVFRNTGNNSTGLFFNSTATQYEFRDGSANPVFTVNYNTGAGTFTGSLKVGAYTLPATDGTKNQVLKTDGNGHLTWKKDLNTIYTAGTGISLASNIITNTAPTQWSKSGNNIVYAPGDAIVNGLTVGVGGGSVPTNTAVGASALESNTTGYQNSAYGYYSLFSNTSGYYNAAYGYYSLYSNTIGSNNTANGSFALYSNTTGNYNTAIGTAVLHSNTTGYSNTANGYLSLFNNTTGNSNTVSGNWALYSNTTGSHNTAIGVSALLFNTTGNSNTANGRSALYYNISGDGNTAFGDSALYSNTTGYINAANGYLALFSNTTGEANTANGIQALFSNTTGVHNSAFGAAALSYNSTGNENTALGYGADVAVNNLSNAMALGSYALVGASNKVQVGSTNVTVIGGQVGWSTFSDGRFKKNIKQNVPGLEFINKLNPVTYTLEIKKFDRFLGKKDSIINSKESQEGYAIGEKKIRTGFIAQEVEKTAQEIGYDFDGINHPQNEKDNYSLIYADFVPSLVKSVQELSAQNDNLQKQIDELKAIVAQLSQENAVSSAQTVNISSLVTSVILDQNIPNPLSNTTSISYFIPNNLHNAQLVITDMNGKNLKQINLQNGKGNVTLDAGTLSAGAYSYSLMVNGKIVATKKMVVAH